MPSTRGRGWARGAGTFRTQWGDDHRYRPPDPAFAARRTRLALPPNPLRGGERVSPPRPAGCLRPRCGRRGTPARAEDRSACTGARSGEREPSDLLRNDRRCDPGASLPSRRRPAARALPGHPAERRTGRRTSSEPRPRPALRGARWPPMHTPRPDCRRCRPDGVARCGGDRRGCRPPGARVHPPREATTSTRPTGSARKR